jgi:predicted RNA-binding protein YlqC (UPF0109 family)
MHHNFHVVLEEYTLLICRALVDYPDDVRVTIEQKDEHTRLRILDYVDCDKGHLLGKDQRIFNAVRTLIQSLGAGQNERVEVTLAEPIADKPRKHHPIAEKWTRDDDMKLAILTAQLLECIPGYTGKVIPEQRADVTLITVKSECLTVPVFTAVSVVVKAAARMRGRRIDMRVAT